LRFGKNGTLVSLSASGKAQKGNKFFVVLLMSSSNYLNTMGNPFKLCISLIVSSIVSTAAFTLHRNSFGFPVFIWSSKCEVWNDIGSGVMSGGPLLKSKMHDRQPVANS
jgi:hypothetical protein